MRRWPLAVTPLLCLAAGSAPRKCSPSSPPVWPSRFKILQRKSPHGVESECQAGGCANTTTYYDWERQANLIIIRPDGAAEGDAMWDLELGSHDSYYFHPGPQTCKYIHFPVGILRPDWLSGANYTGKSVVNGRTVLGWTKVDFIDYYADASDCTPVRWVFHTMQATFDTLSFLEGEQVPDGSFFVPPSYCPNRTGQEVASGLQRTIVL